MIASAMHYVGGEHFLQFVDTNLVAGFFLKKGFGWMLFSLLHIWLLVTFFP